MIKKFEQNDVFVNTIKTTPHFKFSIYNGQVNYKGDFATTVEKGYTALNDLNLNQASAPSLLCGDLFDFSEQCNSQYIPLI